MLRIKRVYEKPSADDGVRILVDRLWPRGLSKTRAQVAIWLKDIAPSTALREWFAHGQKKWSAFRQRYFRELWSNKEAVAELRACLRKNKRATLVFAARDELRNNAVVLKEFLTIPSSSSAGSGTARHRR